MVINKNIWKYAVVGVIAFILIFFIFRFYVIVDAGEQAVIYNKVTGSLRVVRNGFSFMKPLVEAFTIYDMRVKTFDLSFAAGNDESKGEDSLTAITSDGQNVKIDISVMFRPDSAMLVNLHREYGIDYIKKVVNPQVRAVTRLVISNFAVIDLSTGKRQQIQEEIARQLAVLFKRAYLLLEGVMIRNVQFSPLFQETIQKKLEAEKMKYVLEAQELEKKRKIIEAEGEAEAIRVKGKALSENPMLIQYEYVKLLAPNIQAIVTDQNSILNFNDLLKPKVQKK